MDDLGNSQPIQIAKNANINRFAVRKLGFGEKAKVVAEQPVARAEAVKGSTQQKPVIDVEASRNDLGRIPLSNDTSPWEIYGRLTKVLSILCQKHS